MPQPFQTFETIPDVLRERARARPDRAFLALDGEWLTYGELDRGSARVAGYLSAVGIAEGDRVGIVLDNGPELLFAWFGICRLGAIEVPLNTALRRGHLEHCLGNCGMRVLVIGADYLDRLGEIALPATLERLVVVGEAPLPPLPGLAVERFETVLAAAPLHESPATLSSATPAAIIYTSGTTGPSKGVVCPHGHLLALGSETLELLEVGPDDVLYDAHPLYHAHSQGQAVLAAMIADIPLVMRRHFSASGFLADVVHYGVTTAYLIGAAGLVLKQPASPHDRGHRLRVICAVPVPKDQHAALEARFGVPVVDLYGMSEMGVITSNRIDRRVDGSCGLPSPYRAVAIVDALDQPVSQGETGEIVVRPLRPWVTFREYWGMPDKTTEATRNLWFHTGDAGHFDADGFLHFVGRIKDSIRRRGENISAFEVEQAINTHPAVLESAILPYPSPLGEDDVWAIVVPVPGTGLTAPDLIRFCETTLPRFAIPRYVQLAEILPKTPTERIEKYKLRVLGLPPDVFDRENAGGRGTP